MKCLIGLIACFVLSVQLCSAQASEEPSVIKVRIFSTRIIKSLILTSINKDNRTATNFATSSPMSLTLLKDGIHTSATEKPHKQMTFNGVFRIQTDAAQLTIAGRLAIDAAADGMHILLTIPTERYVVAALSGEAAPNEPMESLKAMAVVTRTFTLLNQHRHRAEGFDLCDSTHCQALRFGIVRPEVEEAVLSTTGETLWDGSRRAETYMTQHCGGQTEDAAHVWPDQSATYLRTHTDPFCLRRSAAKWHAEIDAAQALRIFHEQHWSVPMQITTIQVVKRTPSGRAQTLIIGGPDRSAYISASSLRFALNRVLGWNQLRSDWYDVSLRSGTIRFDGKGYGHGVGLCQAGSFEMASEGRSYRDILRFYYPGTNTHIMSADDGWQIVSGSGWTLLTSTTSHALIATGDTAWAKAQSLFPTREQVSPTVHLMPSTELFRQATNQPGWMLASTRGSDVFLQPLRVLQSHEGVDATLLHEFLHVLVEQEATPQTPLWLREGLVEVLAENEHPERMLTAMPLSTVESALAHPIDATDSQRAHLISAWYVQRYIDQYGITAVRGWLRSGVPSTMREQSLPR
jgi:stage II sporulation protein D